ncbi:MAG: nucleoside monophosphate kinase, partial [Verrucomicrobiota bacterium]
MATDKVQVPLVDGVQVFVSVWEELEQKYGSENLRFPKEIMWLGGAPGAGKGTHTPFIMRERGLTGTPIVMSSLLQTPEAELMKKKGYLVGDREVVQLLLEQLLDGQYENGVVVDGFPRTGVQVECVQLLYHKMLQQRARYFDSPVGPNFLCPIFRITILHVREEVSIERQLRRGRQIQAHNLQVTQSGEGELLEMRDTDLDAETAKRRYKVYREQTFDALQSLRNSFHYHFIDANGDIGSVEDKIIEGFQYESSLE